MLLATSITPQREPRDESMKSTMSSNLRDPRLRSDTSSLVSESLSSTSSYRPQGGSTFSSSTAVDPQPVLVKDVNHKPKTTGSFGILIVGLGGANGTTLLAGVLANRLGINWFGPKGEPMTPNYNGCITQLKQKGVYGGVGYKDRIKGLADANLAAVGGWVRMNDSVFVLASRPCLLTSKACLSFFLHRTFDPTNLATLF